MRILELRMSNFMPFRGSTHLAFPQDSYRNVMLFFGDNMRGKTSLLNALRWGLYGKAIGRHSKEIELQDIPNWDAAREGDWEVEVAIKFESGGSIYELRRVANKRPLVAEPRRPTDFQMQTFLKIDDVAVQADQIRPAVNRVVPEQVSRFFLFDGELLQEYEALLSDNSEQGQMIKEAIERVLGVPMIINARDDLSTVLKKVRREQAQDLRQSEHLKTLAARQSALVDKEDRIEADLLKLEEQRARIHDDRLALEDEIERHERAYSDSEKLNRLLMQYREVEEAIRNKQGERREIMASAWEDLLEFRVRLRLEQMQKDYTKISAQQLLLQEKRLRGKSLRKLLDQAVCPTCGQRHPEDQRSRVSSELGTVEADILAMERQDLDVSDLMNEISALSKIRNNASSQRLEIVLADLDRYLVQQTQMEGQIEDLRKALQGYDTAKISRDRIVRDGYLKEETRIQAEIDLKKQELDKVRNEIAMVERTIQGQTGGRAERSTETVTVCSAVREIFDESVGRFRNLLRSEVERNASDAFKRLTTQKNYSGLRINHNYGLTILDENGQDVTIRSAGAEQIVALSLIDGLNRTGKSIGPVIMDTPFGRLDLRHRDNILRYLPDVTTQLVMMVHSGEIRPDTDLEVIKDRIDSTYAIREVTPRHSEIERVAW